MSAFNVSTSLSGIQAGFTRLAVSADNVARRPVESSEKNRVVQSDRYSGGVNTTIQKVPMSAAEKATDMPEYDSSNIDYAEEGIQQIVASITTQANLGVYEKTNEMMDLLVNLTI